ncbi:hypothetical protein GQ55_4G039600 [Panicum hallii var. hallii]|uniref:Uncharacterized protein n=1 Tax=Panicum hallii var. hallii TaxID=1504633 RepID=A0A2T7DV30_9POAL|nr:hypothetical protein GQ55_4G039600 [Panicum hallii var. hallii]
MRAEKEARSRTANSSSMAELLCVSRSKKRRAGEEGEESEAAVAAAQVEDRISALPEDCDSAAHPSIRTGALSTRWRAAGPRRPPWLPQSPPPLRRCPEAAPRVTLAPRPAPPGPLHSHHEHEQAPSHNGASSTARTPSASSTTPHHIDAGNRVVSMFSTFTFPPGCSHLARLVLRHITRVYFGCCRCPLLERLFVQLPSSSHDTFVDNSLEVAEEDEPDAVLFEVDDPR